MAQPDFFKALTGIRAIAAYMVFLHHYNPFKDIAGCEILWGIVNEFHTGVTLFFVLSGFLIAHKYLFDSNTAFKKYFFRRFARIYPLFFILTTITFLWIGIQSPSSKMLLNLYFYNITFLKGLFADIKFTGIAQGWSLTVEEIFYLTAPLWFLAIRKNKIAMVVLPVIIFILGCLIVKTSQSIGCKSFMSSYGFMAIYTFMGRCFEFFAGIALAYMLHLKIKFRFKINYSLLGVLNFLVCIYLISIFKGNHVAGIHHPAGVLINNLILPVFAIVPLFYGLIFEKTLLQKFLSVPFVQLLGKSSYAFYLLHMGVFMSAILKMGLPVWLCFVLITVLSIICFKLIEEPLNIFIRKRFA
ncbi:MAG: acyltransferase [Bacteroidia bacterium]|nr:acyltransferase [Bacteroidia bacterium]HQU99786.1 acyltransferase [Bacteroidia bacterium]